MLMPSVSSQSGTCHRASAEVQVEPELSLLVDIVYTKDLSAGASCPASSHDSNQPEGHEHRHLCFFRTASELIT